MTMKKIIFAMGTRPELIKLSPLIRLVDQSVKFTSYSVASGQHSDLFTMFLDFFEVSIHENLNAIEHSSSLASSISYMISAYAKSFEVINPSLVVVHGDTTTALSASIAAMASQVPVVHVEAGLRTHDYSSPYPEEYNRQLISKIASLNLCPTNSAKQNLINEGILENRCIITGNTIVDSLEYTLARIKSSSQLDDLSRKYSFVGDNFLLLTIHRREHRKERFQALSKALQSFHQIHPDVRFLLPVHANPEVKDLVNTHLKYIPNMILTEPLQYIDMIYLMSKSHFVVTDSGGIQEEVPTLRKVAIVCRNTTERPEALASGFCYLAGISSDKILSLMLEVYSNIYKPKFEQENPYGDGMAAANIFSRIEQLIK
jgi:UDP-N-acetylglucosamine 2-epimerase (non-hydrolysing)